MASDIDMSGSKLIIVADPVGIGDTVNKKYADLKVNKAADEMISNLIIRLLGKNSISFECNDSRASKRFT